MSDEAKEAIERRTEDAFARSGWRDPRADYRALLRALRESDAVAFETGKRDYEARVVARVADPDADPVKAWLDYGLRLAALAGGGRTVQVDEEGRSADAADAPPDQPALLLHLPADESRPAILVAEPRAPSPAQQAAVALLVERRQALPV